jgi:hypothetical protein
MTLVPAKQDFQPALCPVFSDSLVVMTYQIRTADAATTDGSRTLAAQLSVVESGR